MADLLRSITGLLTPGVIRRAAALVGEDPADTQRALNTRVLPAVVAGLAALASSETGAARLRELVDRAASDRKSPLADLGALFSGGGATRDTLREGRDQVEVLFGERRESIVAEIAAASDVQIASASSLLALATPLVLAVLGRERAARDLGTPELARLVLRERDAVATRLTPGLRTLVREARPAPVAVRRHAEAPSIWPRVVAVVLPIVLGAWLLVEWAPWRYEPPPARPVTKRRPVRLPLPSGSALDVPEGSFKHELARYLADTKAAAPRAFLFEDLVFESGRSALAPESERTIADVAAILQEFPSAEIRLEGHTDDVGNADANQRLSLERAETVKAALIAAGVAARRLDAVGFGQERPVAPNDSDEGRAQNRRTELVVTRK